MLIKVFIRIIRVRVRVVPWYFGFNFKLWKRWIPFIIDLLQTRIQLITPNSVKQDVYENFAVVIDY
jgi:hypothetical protein